MEKRLRSSLQTSAEEFLSSAVKLPFKSSKPAIKSLINTLIKPSSDLISTLPLSLCNSISHSISKFKNHSDSTSPASPITPPAKRVRRSARNKEDGGENKRQSILEKLQVYAYVLRLCAFHPKNVFSVSDLLPAVQDLHDNLILFESDSVLLSEIANLCEEWWKGDIIGKETLISQSLPVILSRSLTLKKKVDVHRVYSIRDAFTLFDFEDESIEDLKHLLIRCVISPLYMKTEEGRKFVAFLFGLSVQLTKELCAMIKSQIPFGRKSMLEAYGEIVFRAWKVVEGECKHEIENGFLQGLVEGAIYASSVALATSIRRILLGFVNQRTTEGVEKLIFNLAEPVIFRSLQVANSNVRQNALHLLLDLFPLEDPDATKEAKDTLLEKQFFLVEKLLLDECPDVRVVAVEGSCRILHMFWEVIPSPTITKSITKIFDHMTRDSCTEVRLSTVNGVIYLLGNPQSHEVLKVLLPRLGNLITDSASVVRAALVDLLLLLNDIRHFQFHKVVRIDALFSILADDQPIIARKITKLLIPSYFPSKVTEEEACKRCITLIKRSPTAGARFCEFAAAEGASLRSLMKLFKTLIGLALSSIKLDKEQIEGLLTAASHLCTNLAKDASFKTALKGELSAKNLKTLFAVASTARAQSSVCNLITTLSLDAVGDLFENCMGLITKCGGLLDNIEKQGEVRSAHKMILACGWFDDMFGALVELLQKAASGCHVHFGIELGKQSGKSATRMKTSSKPKRSNQKKSLNTDKNRFLEDYAVAVGVAWQIKDLLMSDSSKEAILCSGNLESTYLALKATSVDLTLEHLLHCAYNVFRANNKKSSESLNTSKMTPGFSKDIGECQSGAQCLVNELFNLFVSVEEFLGYGFAVRFIPVVQLWIPDLILALGSDCLLKEETRDEGTFSLPSWFYILARIELCELIRDAGSDEDTESVRQPNDFPALKRLIETMSKLLKANKVVLDAVGVKFLKGVLSALRSKNFDVVLGLVRFVCVELVGTENEEWKDLTKMLAALGEIYSEVEMDESEGGGEKLESAKALIEPVWKSFIYVERRDVMEED
ncbi:condensin-2 complex subunit g2 [Phtheirospermum japonicum]|uniref:Condensin-2 complex subunit g2 n=1 Tax=Phtheirospermum japonicum TaxID=374723 RepID=A0A830C1S1_9LAMI|nr:condensin-2 complex subunit g2 [Phtheirospermum japonicum]